MAAGRLLLVMLSFLALSFSARGQQFALRQYTAVDGLPQSQVNALVEDQYGYLWIGTSGGGLARFDGRDFKVFSTLDGLLSNVVTSLFIDSHKNIWIVHPRGITRYDGMTFRKFQPANPQDAMRRVRRVVEFNDTIFMVSNPGMIGKIHEDSVYYWSRRILPEKSIFFTHVSVDHQICYYLSDSSFLVPSPGGNRRFSHKRIFGKAYNIFNHGHEVWVDTDSGSFALDLKSGEFARRRKVIDRYIIGYDTLHDAYWTRNERTLFRQRLVNGVIESDTVLENIPIMQLLMDTEGNTWFGSAGNGLYRYYARDFEKVAIQGPIDIKAIQKDDQGNLWLGGEGLWLVNGNRVTTFNLPNKIDDGVHVIRQSPAGAVWVAAFSGLGKYLPEKKSFNWYTRQHGLSSAYVTAIDFDDQEGLWIGTTGGGLNYYDGKQFSVPQGQDVMKSRNITALRYVPKVKRLFIGTDFGLHEMQDGIFRTINIPEFENTTILSLATFRDSLLLVGSGGGGVMVMDPKTIKRKQIGPREGLPSGFVFFVVEDASGWIWVGTEKGITRMKLDDHWEITQTRDFGFENGLVGIETNQGAYFLSGNEKYFGLIDGIYRFNDASQKGIRSYPVHLTDLEIRYGEVSSRTFGRGLTGFFKIPDHPALPSDQNHITFHFNRVDKRYPQSVRYKYFLQNFDKTWSQPSGIGKVTYSNLPPGDFVFRVMSTDGNGSWDVMPLDYPFSITAPFYRTSAFYLVMGGLVFGSLVLFVLVRMRKNVSRAIEVEHIRQQEQESLRKEIARDFHDEMGNQLTRIINYVSLMRLSNGHGSAPELYHKVEESAKYLYNGTRDFIWAIDPVNDDLGKLFLHVRDFGEKLFEEKNIHFRAYNEIKEKIRLPYGFSREANLIFKEAMTNAFKHSEAVNVSFFLRKLGEEFEMVLEDDGIGLDFEKIKLSNGIKNIRSRAEKIQSSLVIVKVTQDKGTRVQLRFTTTKKNAYDPQHKKTRIDR